jgi:hypothetical protein
VTDVEISPQSWEYRLVAAVVYAVEQRSRTAGGPRTRWNGRVIEEDDPQTLGAAHSDGSISVSVQHVLVPLRQARDLNRPLTEQEAWRIRDAMDTLTHEAAHLMAPLGDVRTPEAYPYDDAAAAFDEGRTEHWTKRNLGLVIDDVFSDAGLDHVKAAVLAQPDVDAYPAYTTAVRQVDKALAERSGLTSAEVTQKLMCADDAQRWNVAVDMVIDKQFAEPGLMPESHRAAVRKLLVAPLHRSMDALAKVDADDSLTTPQKTEAARQAAQNAIAGLDTEISRIERHYRIAIAQRTQESQRTASRQNPAARQTQQNVSPDLKRLRAVTSGQAPAAGATSWPAAAAEQAQSEPRDGSRGQQAKPRTGPQAPGLG